MLQELLRYIMLTLAMRPPPLVAPAPLEPAPSANAAKEVSARCLPMHLIPCNSQLPAPGLPRSFTLHRSFLWLVGLSCCWKAASLHDVTQSRSASPCVRC